MAQQKQKTDEAPKAVEYPVQLENKAGATRVARSAAQVIQAEFDGYVVKATGKDVPEDAPVATPAPETGDDAQATASTARATAARTGR